MSNTKPIPFIPAFSGSTSLFYSDTSSPQPSSAEGWKVGSYHHETMVPLCHSLLFTFFLWSGLCSPRAAVLQEYLLHHGAPIPFPSLLTLVFPLLFLIVLFPPPLPIWCFHRDAANVSSVLRLVC